VKEILPAFLEKYVKEDGEPDQASGDHTTHQDDDDDQKQSVQKGSALEKEVKDEKVIVKEEKNVLDATKDEAEKSKIAQTGKENEMEVDQDAKKAAASKPIPPKFNRKRSKAPTVEDPPTSSLRKKMKPGSSWQAEEIKGPEKTFSKKPVSLNTSKRCVMVVTIPWRTWRTWMTRMLWNTSRKNRTVKGSKRQSRK